MIPYSRNFLPAEGPAAAQASPAVKVSVGAVVAVAANGAAVFAPIDTLAVGAAFAVPHFSWTTHSCVPFVLWWLTLIQIRSWLLAQHSQQLVSHARIMPLFIERFVA